MFWINLCNLDMRAGRVIKFAISIFLRISRNFGWESCETNLLRRTVGAAFYGVWRLWNQVDNRLHALRDTVGGCILRHLVNTGTNLVNLCYSTDDSVGRECKSCERGQCTASARCVSNPFGFTSSSLQVYILRARKHIMQLCILLPTHQGTQKSHPSLPHYTIRYTCPEFHINIKSV